MSDNDSKFLLQVFNVNFLELVKQKGLYPYEYRDCFKNFSDEKVPDRCGFSSSLKDKCFGEKEYFQSLMFGFCVKWI